MTVVQPKQLFSPSYKSLSGIPAANAVLSFQETRYKDGGAHWYRSSAALLRYHKYVVVVCGLLKSFYSV
jgi:hypothetical protein